MFAEDSGRLDIANALIAAGASVDVQNRDGWTALMWAADSGHLDIVRVL